ncbi:MAG TPA: iron-sulfur cluster assembly scaffold protein [Bryobacteraceae bacterium]
MYSDTLLDHFRNPRNVGELAPPAITVEVSNPACGDILRLSALIEEGKVAESRYRVRGCTASIAAGSALTEMMVGRTSESLSSISAGDVEERLDGLPSASKHAAALCLDGVRALMAALTDPQRT